MGVVIKVRDKELARDAAIKILLFGGRPNDEEMLARFSREAKALARLEHPNIVKLLSWGLSEDGCPYQVMEFLDGQPLSKLIEKQAPFSISLFGSTFMQVLSGLAHAHKEGIIHRDLKPSNIMVSSPAGSNSSSTAPVKLIDFGIARQEGTEEQKLTRTEAVLGSPLYMSPEQCLSQDISTASDVYSLACIMYQCLTGRTPFSSESPIELMYMHSNQDFEKLETMTELASLKPLGRLIDSCLCKSPELRPSARQIQDELRNIVQSQTQSRRFLVKENLQNSRRPLFLLVVLLALTGFFASVWLLKQKSQKQSMSHLQQRKDNANKQLKRAIKALQAKRRNLEFALAGELALKRKEEIAIEIIETCKVLAQKLSDDKQSQQALRVLNESLGYCQFVENKEPCKARILKSIACTQLFQEQYDEALKNSNASLSLFKSSDLLESSDAFQSKDIKIAALLHLHKYPEAKAFLPSYASSLDLMNKAVLTTLAEHNSFAKTRPTEDKRAHCLLTLLKILKYERPSTTSEKAQSAEIALSLLSILGPVASEKDFDEGIGITEFLLAGIPDSEEKSAFLKHFADIRKSFKGTP